MFLPILSRTPLLTSPLVASPPGLPLLGPLFGLSALTPPPASAAATFCLIRRCHLKAASVCHQDTGEQGSRAARQVGTGATHAQAQGALRRLAQRGLVNAAQGQHSHHLAMPVASEQFAGMLYSECEQELLVSKVLPQTVMSSMPAPPTGAATRAQTTCRPADRTCSAHRAH